MTTRGHRLGNHRFASCKVEASDSIHVTKGLPICSTCIVKQLAGIVPLLNFGIYSCLVLGTGIFRFGLVFRPPRCLFLFFFFIRSRNLNTLSLSPLALISPEESDPQFFYCRLRITLENTNEKGKDIDSSLVRYIRKVSQKL
jgi:hypothetical protein